MSYAGPRFLLALGHVHGVLAAVGLAVGLVGVAVLAEDRLFGLPFVANPVRLVRMLPALIAGCGGLVLASEWLEFEWLSVRSLRRLSAARFLMAAVVILVAAAGAGAVADDSVVFSLSVLLFGGYVVALVLLGSRWWLAVPFALYGQFFVPSVNHLPGSALVSITLLGLSAALYVSGYARPTILRGDVIRS
ncbi:MAG: hypothetical protein ACRCYU_21945 [Nocardioides sp.]